MKTTANSGNNSETKRGRIENLKPFKPGQSGNISGRPKKTPMALAYAAKLDQIVPGDPEGRTYAQIIVDAIVRQAIKGNVRAVAEITDRVEGRAIQRAEFMPNPPEDDPKEKLRALIAKLRTTHDDQNKEIAAW